MMKTVFGPVPSRRLGRSLGIDVIPAKTCSYDCVYCESGRTTHLSIKREVFLAPDQIMQDLETYFRIHPQGADVLTFSSAGEPTLYEPLGELLKAIKSRFTSLPVVILTNGSLFWDPHVRQALMRADRIVPSLDAVTQASFQEINRPHPALDLRSILEGLEALRQDYRGQLHIEILLASGYNDQPDQWKAMRRVIDRLNPDRVELNTVVRPPANPHVCGLPPHRMEEALSYFPREKTQVIGRFQAADTTFQNRVLAERVIEMVRRRPCTADEMAESLSVSKEDLLKAVAELIHQGKLIQFPFDKQDFLCAPSSEREASQ